MHVPVYTCEGKAWVLRPQLLTNVYHFIPEVWKVYCCKFIIGEGNGCHMCIYIHVYTYRHA